MTSRHTAANSREPGARPLALSVMAVLLASLVFWLWPRIDMAVSAAFYEAGAGFPARRAEALVWLRRGGMAATRIAIAGLALWAVAAILRPRILESLRPSGWLFLAGTLALGPGILVNAILKDFWGRPRPVHIGAFGGDAPYVPVWKITDYCASNCSFVSGEASTSFWLLAFAFVVPRLWRLPVLCVVLCWSFAVSATRIAFGGHFLSDVVLSWLLTLVVILALRRWLLSEPRRSAIDAGAKRALSFIR